MHGNGKIVVTISVWSIPRFVETVWCRYVFNIVTITYSLLYRFLFTYMWATIIVLALIQYFWESKLLFSFIFRSHQPQNKWIIQFQSNICGMLKNSFTEKHSGTSLCMNQANLLNLMYIHNVYIFHTSKIHPLNVTHEMRVYEVIWRHCENGKQRNCLKLISASSASIRFRFLNQKILLDSFLEEIYSMCLCMRCLDRETKNVHATHVEFSNAIHM